MLKHLINYLKNIRYILSFLTLFLFTKINYTNKNIIIKI